MTEDIYILAITALLPLTSWMLVVQVNPYHALVIRGILGAVAALVYALFGAADVALTEALVGTMLSITLYAVAVRSSLSMRMGVLDQDSTPQPEVADAASQGTAVPQLLAPLLSALNATLSHAHLRLEVMSYGERQTLEAAFMAGEIHTTCIPTDHKTTAPSPQAEERPAYQLQTRVQRLYEIMQTGLPDALADLIYVESSSPNPSQSQPSELSDSSQLRHSTHE